MNITAHQSWRESRRALLLSLLALGALGLVACSGGDDDDERTTEARLSPEQKIEQAGNDWAALFAGRERFCELMTQPACERMDCESVSGPIRDCTPPSLGIGGRSKTRRSRTSRSRESTRVPGSRMARRSSWITFPVPILTTPSASMLG
jgi:hypothetical protein